MKTKLTLFVAVIAVALFGMGCASTEPAFVSDGLVAYYPFNGNAKDESGNGNDGEVKGPEAAMDRNGRNNSSFDFSGKGVIQLPDNLLDGEQEATISAWVYSEPAPKNGLVGAIVFAGDARSAFDPICARLKGGREPYIQFSDCKQGGLNGINSSPLNVRASITVPVKQWSQFTWTLSKKNESPSVSTIYVDGMVKFSGNSGKGFKAITYDKPMPVSIGGILGSVAQERSFDPNMYWYGRIDDVRFYNRALTEEQVKALYELEKPKAE